MPRHFLLLTLCILAYICGGMISMLMSVYLPSVVEDLLGKDDIATIEQVGPYLNASYLAGMTAGGILLGVLSDRFGRVQILAASALVCGLFTLAAIGAKDWVWVAATRTMAGCGVAGILLTCAVLVSEQWPVKSRAVAQGILGVAFPIGIVLSGALNMVFNDWRQAFSVGFIPIIVSVLVITLLNLQKMHSSTTTVTISGSKSLFLAQNRQKLIIGIAVYGFVLVGVWAVFSWMPTWVDNLIGGGEQAGKMRGITMMVLGIGGMIGTGISGPLVNHFGVRSTLLANFAGTFGICTLLFLSNRVFSPLILIETVALSLFFGAGQGALTVYVTEMFPTEIRATGTGFCFNVGRVFTTSSVFFVGSLVTALGGFANAMLTFSTAFVIAWVILIFDKNSKSPA